MFTIVKSQWQNNDNQHTSQDKSCFLNKNINVGASTFGNGFATSVRKPEVYSSSHTEMCHRSLEKAMRKPVVRDALKLGFAFTMVKCLVAKKLRDENAEYTSAVSLVSDLQIEEQRSLAHHNKDPSSIDALISSVSACNVSQIFWC